MGQMRPHPRILTIWRITLALAMIIPAFLNALLFPLRSTVWFWLSAIWVLAFLALYLVYLPLRFRGLSYTVDENRILLYSGVIYNRERSIPLQNIQFTTIYLNPFGRLFGLCALVVTSAGGRVTLPGLLRHDADRLAQALQEHR